MDATRRRSFRAALLIGLVYLIVGRVFARPTDHVRVWRLSAWVVSAIAYGGHIAYEHFEVRNGPRITATHVALAVAIGSAGLAIAALMHSWSTGSAPGPARVLAFIVWPVMTAIPAFLVALAVAALVSRRRR